MKECFQSNKAHRDLNFHGFKLVIRQDIIQENSLKLMLNFNFEKLYYHEKFKILSFGGADLHFPKLMEYLCLFLIILSQELLNEDKFIFLRGYFKLRYHMSCQ